MNIIEKLAKAAELKVEFEEAAYLTESAYNDIRELCKDCERLIKLVEQKYQFTSKIIIRKEGYTAIYLRIYSSIKNAKKAARLYRREHWAGNIKVYRVENILVFYRKL